MMDAFMVGYFPRIHTALAEWLACMALIGPLHLRDFRDKRLLLPLVFLATLLATFYVMERAHVQGLLWTAMMALAMMQMFGLILLFDWPSGVVALYCWAHAFLMAELAASVEWNINFYLIKGGVVRTMGGTYVCMALVYLLVFGFVFAMRRREDIRDGLRLERSSVREALSASGIAIGAFIISNIQFAFQNTPFFTVLDDGVLYARTLVDLSGVIMLYAHNEQRREMALRVELDAMSVILQRQYEQYQQFAANNDALHRVYHDLKHQIAYLESETNREKRLESLEEMKEIIRTHESQVNTGNRVLDVLLTSKSLICAEEGILMTCYADAEPLSFMSAMDVCSIFGNTIDNAIEHERTVTRPEDRLIKVHVGARGAFLLIRIQNYCESPVRLQGGLPATTKADKQLHGYGLRSVRQTAERYHGHMDLTQENGWFTVTVLIPRKEG